MVNQYKIVELSLAEASKKIRNKEISPMELYDASITRIREVNPELTAYISIYEQNARKVAEETEKQISNGEYLGPLQGIPISLKDNIAMKGLNTTAGSKVLENWKPNEDATVVEKLKNAGTNIIGKTHLHEFAWGITSINPKFGTARNPWDTTRTPLGSSGGSGAAVAARTTFGALGTDTGGSVRAPSSINGIVGIRPTIGRVSNYGVIPLAWSMDTVGPMARTVEDCAIMFNALAGYDPKDSGSSKTSVPDYTKDIDKGIEGLKIGVVPNYFFKNVQESVLKAYKSALSKLEELGAHIEEVNIASIEESRNAQLIVNTAEPSVYHQKWLREQPENYGDDVRQLLEVGEMYLASHYIQAQRYRSLLHHEFMEAFKDVDVFISPTLPFTATKIGDEKVTINGKEEDVLPAFMQFTSVPGMAGMPALSLPCGFDDNGLPIGMQVMGKPFDEETLFMTGNAYQKETDFHKHSPINYS